MWTHWRRWVIFFASEGRVCEGRVCEGWFTVEHNTWLRLMAVEPHLHTFDDSYFFFTEYVQYL